MEILSAGAYMLKHIHALDVSPWITTLHDRVSSFPHMVLEHLYGKTAGVNQTRTVKLKVQLTLVQRRFHATSRPTL